MKKQSIIKQNGINELFFAVTVVVLIAMVMVKIGKQCNPVISTVITSTDPMQSSLVPVRQDSLVQLLNHFAARHSSMATIKSDNDFLYVQLGRLGSNASIFYSSNNALLQVSKDNFQIKVTPVQGIDAQFKRTTAGGISYVDVPTDVLFGILK